MFRDGDPARFRDEDEPWLDVTSAAAAAVPEDGRVEPVLVSGPLLISFEPIFIGFEDEPPLLDPLDPEDVPPPASVPPPRLRPGALGSLAVHLSPLLLLLSWTPPPAAPPPPIAVQLVIEEPPPSPPSEARRPPPDRLASEEAGPVPDPPAEQPVEQPVEKPVEKPAEQPVEQPAPAAPPAPPPKLAGLVPPPKPPVPRPVPLPGPALPEPARIAPPKAPALRPAERRPRGSGPVLNRDEYLAALVPLTRRYLYMLPASVIAGRQGATVLAIRLLADGTIARVSVAQGSGYPDIDARVVQMITAIKRFPPLPQWIQEPSWNIRFRLRFPVSEADASGR